VAAGQLGLTGGCQPIFVFFPNPQKTSIHLLLEAQQHKKYAQTTPLDGVSSLFLFDVFVFLKTKVVQKKLRIRLAIINILINKIQGLKLHTQIIFLQLVQGALCLKITAFLH
jgi:hypothetical protein